MQREDKFYIIVDSIQYTKFMSPPASSGANAADTSSYFVAGIVKGYLDCSGFPAECVPPCVCRRLYAVVSCAGCGAALFERW